MDRSLRSERAVLLRALNGSGSGRFGLAQRSRVTGPRRSACTTARWPDWLALVNTCLVFACGPEKLRPPAFSSFPRRGNQSCFIHLEGEDFFGAWAEQTNLTPYYGRGFRVSNARGVARDGLEMQVDMPAGLYTVWSHGFRDHRAQDWRVAINDVTLPPTHGPLVIGEEPGFSWVRAGEVSLEAGIASVRIEDVADSWEVVDAVVLSSAPDFDMRAQEEAWRILPPGTGREMLLAHLVQSAEELSLGLPRHFDRTEWLERQAELVARVRDDVGLSFDFARPDVAFEFKGEIKLDGYRVDKIVFESRPNMWVPAHVYVPDGVGPFPVVLSPVGHYWQFAKSEGLVAARAHGLAKLGYVVLTYDPFGQGERQVGGHGHGVHWPLLLTGRTNLTLMVYDTMRALDYLASRSDTDTSKVVCTGASGGGLNTVIDCPADRPVPRTSLTAGSSKRSMRWLHRTLCRKNNYVLSS